MVNFEYSPIKIRTRTDMSDITISIQHCAVGSSQCNKVGGGEGIHIGKEEVKVLYSQMT